ncbi:hypothetical protein GE061_017469 [Apolygus lucorum]|uniref:lysozyme n=1 Tax=Apolygus lucorum TaxID=248454 RepID=A0A8S9XAY5_APOLU|nr:hypothetical protein GE061_017469 [Apolygus lucorum]
MWRLAVTTLVILSLLDVAYLKRFGICELALDLADEKYHVPLSQIPTWVCMAMYLSGLDTSHNYTGIFGLFGIPGQYWCGQCDITCDKLTNDDLSEDVACAQLIYNRYNSENRSGFKAWAATT